VWCSELLAESDCLVGKRDREGGETTMQLLQIDSVFPHRIKKAN
jgi:hypothetical protein